MESVIVMITTNMVTPSSTINVLILTLVLNCLAPSQAVSIHHLLTHSSKGTHGKNQESAMKHQGETLRIKTFRDLFGMMRSVNNYMTTMRSRHNRRRRKLSRTSLRNLLAASLNPSLSSLNPTLSSLNPTLSSLNPAVDLQYPPPVHSSNPAGFAHNAAVSSQNPASYSRKQTRVTSKNPVLDSENPGTVSQIPTISTHRLTKGYSSLTPTHDITKAIQSISKSLNTKRYRIRHFKIQYGNNRPFDSLASGLIG